MAEATQRLEQDKLRASMAFAARVRALQLATNEVKAQLQRQGLRLSQVTYRELRVSAEQYLADHREELFASAKVDVERWRLNGVFGKKAMALQAGVPGLVAEEKPKALTRA
jgi:hypothetical protein